MVNQKHSWLQSSRLYEGKYIDKTKANTQLWWLRYFATVFISPGENSVAMVLASLDSIEMGLVYPLLLGWISTNDLSAKLLCTYQGIWFQQIFLSLGCRKFHPIYMTISLVHKEVSWQLSGVLWSKYQERVICALLPRFSDWGVDNPVDNAAHSPATR